METQTCAAIIKDHRLLSSRSILSPKDTNIICDKGDKSDKSDISRLDSNNNNDNNNNVSKPWDLQPASCCLSFQNDGSSNLCGGPKPAATMTWGYAKDNGPDTWAENFPAAAGIRQSPVDIVPDCATYDEGLAANPLTIDYTAEENLELENPGLSFKANISKDCILSGGPLGGTKYKLVQFHMHWGHEDKEGSEHTVNGKMYPSELHLVHYNSDKYASFGDAVAQSDGLAVLGIFIKVGSSEHAGFKTLSEHSEKVKCKGQKEATGAGFDPSVLLPGNTNNYWTYEGSLTTPPCCESVRWIVFQDEIEVSESQIGALRSLCCDECGEQKIPANYRPPLPLGNRQLKASFQSQRL